MKRLTLLCLLLVATNAAIGCVVTHTPQTNAEWHRRCDTYRTHPLDAWPECRDHLLSEMSAEPTAKAYRDRYLAEQATQEAERAENEERMRRNAAEYWAGIRARREIIDSIAREKPHAACVLKSQLAYDLCVDGWAGTGKRSDCKADFTVAVKTCDEVFRGVP